MHTVLKRASASYVRALKHPSAQRDGLRLTGSYCASSRKPNSCRVWIGWNSGILSEPSVRHVPTTYHGSSLSPPRPCFGARHFSWIPWKLNLRAPEPYNEPSDGQEEAAKVAMLEKAMKGRQPADLMLRCTILDADGNVKTISGQFRKADLCAEHRLNPRDLRKIDSRIPNLVPTVLVRKEAILVNILHIRALVKADAVVLFDTYGSADSRLHSVFLYHLEHNLKGKANGLPYEFRALESVLLSVLSALEAEMVFIRNLVGGLLAELEDDIDHDRFKRLLHYSRRLASFQNRAKLVQEALEEVLEQDEDLAAMYLTDKMNGNPRKLSDHEDLEVLLESFHKQVEEIVNEAENIQSNVQSTQEIVELVLDSNRNALLALDLKISIMTMGVGIGTLVAGLFGMNLKSHIEDNPYAFALMSVCSIVMASAFSWVGLRRLARVRKVRLATNGRKNSPTLKDSLPLNLRGRGDGWSA
ncbi:cora-domain-containing protein [Wolfiporia cocos MD-104 SS10]|uniref:Magnesium transporter n=1 Tax=Wolfiporia cocos (strain MD-104) TaxID=742152 RepID=A0A2H3K0T4_WOLCO|nr:cora-domain-containing protein [Wolfiporia cocos MD-104 SS10]